MRAFAGDGGDEDVSHVLTSRYLAAARYVDQRTLHRIAAMIDLSRQHVNTFPSFIGLSAESQ